MVDQELLNELHQEGLIDKNAVLWWQIGFEGRREISEEEFRQNLETRTWKTVKFKDGLYEVDESGNKILENRTFQTWPGNDVPFFTHDIKFFLNRSIPTFVTIKPISHEWESICKLPYLDYHRESNLPLPFNNQPHVRGVVIEKTPEFLFWTPLLYANRPVYYHTFVFAPKNEEFPFMLDPIAPDRFYRSTYYHGLGDGRRKRTLACQFDESGYEFVPYYEFDHTKKQVTLYPGPVHENRLESPILIKGGDGQPHPEILGRGWAYSDIQYTPLDRGQEKRVRAALIERLGVR